VGTKPGEERRLPGPGRGERTKGTSGDGGPAHPARYQLGHLEKGRVGSLWASITTNARSCPGSTEIYKIFKIFLTKQKYSKKQYS